ncbi:hypothetical protein HD597_007499 [Nonomuraea thailandensis]|uniref:Uncharacterized protein n=1 Tax=Nonomuraea thailandensis TaxID=1188745 RepID=A0A9X2GJU0_9ACTN|nr:hypothetical protein [Nonomuraea thailandensis]MCP2360479.1 hypothetical protein [Nonomuraea thailandensis]
MRLWRVQPPSDLVGAACELVRRDAAWASEGDLLPEEWAGYAPGDVRRRPACP